MGNLENFRGTVDSTEYVKLLRQNFELVLPEKLDPETCCDPDDHMVLVLLLPGGVQAIQEGNKDLLILEIFKGLPVMSLRAFWEFSQSEVCKKPSATTLTLSTGTLLGKKGSASPFRTGCPPCKPFIFR